MSDSKVHSRSVPKQANTECWLAVRQLVVLALNKVVTAALVADLLQ